MPRPCRRARRLDQAGERERLPGRPASCVSARTALERDQGHRGGAHARAVVAQHRVDGARSLVATAWRKAKSRDRMAAPCSSRAWFCWSRRRKTARPASSWSICRRAICELAGMTSTAPIPCTITSRTRRRRATRRRRLFRRDVHQYRRGRVRRPARATGGLGRRRRARTPRARFDSPRRARRGRRAALRSSGCQTRTS